ncbi:MAG: hypothetical protein KOO60_09055 [Gemmatimonadales bacterium]|nr:hypothetical protein [Gemmatimonadales bacterium]
MIRFSGSCRFLFLLGSMLLSGIVSGQSNLPSDQDSSAVGFDRWCLELDARPEARTRLFFSPEIGQELDAGERKHYGLLGNTFGFHSARLPVSKTGEFMLEIALQKPDGRSTISRKFSASSLRLTRLHCYLRERFSALPPLDTVAQNEAELMLRLALRFASRSRYDLVEGVLDDLGRNFGDTDAGFFASQLLPDVRALRTDRQALIWDQPPKRGEGSNDLKLFGGYFGLWLGMAVPMALDADSVEIYGLGLMAGGPCGFVLASAATRKWNISEGQAAIIELGGNLGTWQGLGWASVGSSDEAAVVGSGVLCGLAGIGGAAWLTSKYEFSEGHAAITAAALPWGAWFGLVAAVISETDTSEGWDDNKSMLIGSNALVLTAGRMARNVEMSEKRVRLINLSGIIGTVMAMGLEMIVQPDDQGVIMGTIGAGGAIGLAAGFHLTAGVDEDKYAGRFQTTGTGLEIASRPTVQFPRISVQPNLMTGRGMMPAVEAGITF